MTEVASEETYRVRRIRLLKLRGIRFRYSGEVNFPHSQFRVDWGRHDGVIRRNSIFGCAIGPAGRALTWAFRSHRVAVK